MVAVTISISKPDFRGARSERDRFRKDQRKAAFEVTDIAANKAQKHIQAKMRSVNLGKLANAVGYTSAKKKRQFDNTPYGVIYARGGDESLAGGALEAYSQGTTITPYRGAWLAIPTEAAPRFIRVGGKRKRLTPSLYKSAGLESTIGKLHFRLIKPDMALLIVKNVSLSPKTGRARALGPRRPRTRVVPDRDTVVFILIKQTRRAKRFDKDEIVGFYLNRMPEYLARTLEGYRRGIG